MNDTTQKSGQENKPEPSIIVGGVLLPPLDLRTGQQEDELRQVVRKDIQAYCPAPWAQQPQIPWSLRQSESPALRDLLGSQTPLLHQNTLLSADGFNRDVSHVETEGDPQGTAREAEQSPANTLIETEEEEEGKSDDPFDPKPRVSIESSGRTEAGWKGSATRYSDGQTERKGGATDTYQDTGRVFDGKYKVGVSASGPSDERALASGKDTEGFGQGSFAAGYRGYETGAGVATSGNWAGGDVHIDASAKANASAGLFKGNGSLNEDGLISGKGNVDLVSAQALAEGGLRVGTFEGSPTATLNGKIALKGVLAEAGGGLELSVTPRRIHNAFAYMYNGVANWAEWDTRIEELDEKWDWGFFIEVGGTGSVGIGGEGEIEAGALEDGKKGVRAKLKAMLGIGGGVKLGTGLVTPGK